MSQLTLIDPGDACLQYLPWMAHMLQRKDYIEKPAYDAEYVAEKVYNGLWQLWFAFEPEAEPSIMMLTYVNTFPKGRVATIETVVGKNLFSLTSCYKSFEAWCRLQGIVSIHTITNPTFARYAARYGFIGESIAVHKDLIMVN